VKVSIGFLFSLNRSIQKIGDIDYHLNNQFIGLSDTIPKIPFCSVWTICSPAKNFLFKKILPLDIGIGKLLS